MKENNPCIESGCPGHCCKNVFLELTKCERTRIFPDAIKVKNLTELNNVPRDYPDYYFTPFRNKKFPTGEMVKLLIVGRCPHLLWSGNCDIHEERSNAAKNVLIGSEYCNEVRRSYGLPAIPQQKENEL